MQSLLTSTTVLAYLPVVLLGGGSVLYHFYEKKNRKPAATGLPPQVIDLFNAVDELALEFMRDSGTTGLGDATRKAFLDVVTAKTVARRGC